MADPTQPQPDRVILQFEQGKSPGGIWAELAAEEKAYHRGEEEELSRRLQEVEERLRQKEAA